MKSDDEEQPWHDLQDIGEKIVEMAERAKVAHAVHPGAQATWGIRDDEGTHFQVIVKVLDD